MLGEAGRVYVSFFDRGGHMSLLESQESRRFYAAMVSLSVLAGLAISLAYVWLLR
jgi:hypothetical protein